ncbi:hypothetical protein MFLAVUS_011118 [Mucor flavus]|uniref:COMM domain-containing protein n=1 Tax=Mucor flavus TaxID=439312 RepID=A0ABP9ZEL9_9FUNG
MNYVQDSWLDSLVKHSIFDLTQQEKQSLTYLKESQTRQQPVIDFILQHHNRIIAQRENDLFVAIGSQIRVINLTEFKDAWMEASREANEEQLELSDNWIHSVPYKVLDTPEINFYIDALLPNSNGRLLSVAGQSQLVIVCLPRQGFSDVSLSRKKVDCRTLSIGTKYYSTYKNEVIKVQWHPLSETRTHIVVLGSDNTLRMFDISKDIDEPEQEFDLSPVSTQKQVTNTRGGFSFDDDDHDGEEDAVTFSVGGTSQDQSGWEPFTIFYGLRNGHLYSICPVIPYKSTVRRNHLETLSCLSRVKYEQVKRTNKPLSMLFELHSDWIRYLFESAKVAQNLDNDALTVTSSKEHMPYAIKRQGPFLTNHTVSLADGIQVTDILYITVDVINMVALALNNGSVRNYIIGSEIDAQWQLPVTNAQHTWEKELALLLSESDFLPRASLYETINLNSGHLPPFQRVSLTHDPLYSDTYYAYHAGGVHAISTNQWIKQLVKLNRSIENGVQAEQSISDWLNQKQTSKVRLLVNSSPFKDGFVPIVGLVMITDIYLSYSLLCLTDDYRLVTRGLSMRRELSKNDGSEKEAIQQQLKSVAGDSETGYQPLLSLPAFQIPTQLDNLPKQPKIVVPANMGGSKELVITDESLLFFSKSSEQFRNETFELKKAAITIDKRLTIQQKEFERQVSTLRDLYDRLQVVRSNDAKVAQEKKLKELHQTHAKLRLRIDEQLHKLMNTYQPDLSNEEKEWVNKLEDLSKQIDGDSGYVARIQQLRSQFEQLEVSDEPVKTLVPNINATQLNNVLRSLNEQKSSISDLEHRFQNLRTKLPVTA